MSKNFYITTTLPYVNAEPHIGFAMELLRADVVARWKKSQGFDVFFNTGTDEHGLKIFESAKKSGVIVEDFVNSHSKKFQDLLELLHIDPSIHFIRTTDEKHIRAAKEMWKRCKAAGDIEKKIYKTKYCVGCELEKTDSELVDGKCILHPNIEIEVREEENYFFRFSKFQKQLLDLYRTNPKFVIPESRFNEIKTFVEHGIEDFSVSRLKSKMPWGIEVPNDPEHIMYVWFDALVNYISTLGWPDDKETFDKYWLNGSPTQYAGKDNLRQQSAMWQAILMSAGLPNSHQIIINGFINSGGQKMSKSLGNVISPYELVSKYGTDATRYLLLRHVHSTEDTDVTWERLDEWYEAGLVNGLGNLVARIMQMATQYLDGSVDVAAVREMKEVDKFVENFESNRALNSIWSYITDLDEQIQEEKPFEVVKADKLKAQKQVTFLVKELERIARNLELFMPKTAENIRRAIKENKKPENLFPRLNA